VPKKRRKVTDGQSQQAVEEKVPSAESAKQLAEAISKIDVLPEATRAELIETISYSFSGPLPPPLMLARYNDVVPGAGATILEMAKKEQSIRDRDNRKLLHNERLKIAGAILVSLAFIGAGAFCAYLGQPVLGGVVGLGGVIASIIREFLRRNNDQSN
jgi:uncharacterized membrane protein